MTFVLVTQPPKEGQNDYQMTSSRILIKRLRVLKSSHIIRVNLQINLLISEGMSNLWEPTETRLFSVVEPRKAT